VMQIRRPFYSCYECNLKLSILERLRTIDNGGTKLTWKPDVAATRIS
jgi:hypothetical protein